MRSDFSLKTNKAYRHKEKHREGLTAPKKNRSRTYTGLTHLSVSQEENK